MPTFLSEKQEFTVLHYRVRHYSAACNLMTLACDHAFIKIRAAELSGSEPVNSALLARCFRFTSPTSLASMQSVECQSVI